MEWYRHESGLLTPERTFPRRYRVSEAVADAERILDAARTISTPAFPTHIRAPDFAPWSPLITHILRPQWMNAIAQVAKGEAENASSASVTLNMTGSSLIIVTMTHHDAASDFSVSDDSSNTYSLAVSRVDGNGGIRIYYAENPTVDSSVQVTAAATTFFGTVFVSCWSGCKTSGVIGHTTTNAAAASPGSITPDENNCLLVSHYFKRFTADGGYSVSGTGWTKEEDNGSTDFTDFGGAWGTNLQTTAAASNPTWSGSGGGGQASAMAYFRPASAATTVRPRSLIINQARQRAAVR